MSNLGNSRDQLSSEWLSLQRQWQTTAAQWNDAVRHRFEREFIQEYEPVVLTTLKELDKLTQVIAQAQREVK